MHRVQLELFVLSALLATCCTANPDTIDGGIVVSNVQRTVDVSSHLPKITSSVTIQNGGKGPIRSFLFAIDPSVKNRVSFVSAVTKVDEDEKKLDVKETTVTNQQGKVFYKVSLPSSLEVGKEITVDVDSYHSHTLKPYPSEIAQNDKQLVTFTANLYLYTPYKTTKQSTVVKCSSGNIESYTKLKPVSSADNEITYGPFENKEAFSEEQITVHFENNSPFLTVTSLTRVVEVSHWGNIAVEETLDIRHTGAQLKGPFSRYDYQRSPDTAASIKSFKTILPSSARDVYYRDEIGNISTSNLKELDDSVELELRPRFPLFGGWKTHYTIGYNVPSYQYLFNSGDNYKLKMRLVDHIYDDQVIDDFTIRIILPEGTQNLKLETPYKVEQDKSELHYTYLDTVGRPVIVAHKKDLVEQHIQDFTLHYTFSKINLLQEPLLAVGAFYVLFLTVILYVRIDFSITKDEASESRMRVAGLVEQVQGIHDRRSALYQSYDDAINKFKSQKDVNAFQSNRKKIDADYKQLTQQINSLVTKLKAESEDVAHKIDELQSLDAQVREQTNLAIQYAEKLIAGKLSKPQYIDYETTVKQKREALDKKMDQFWPNL